MKPFYLNLFAVLLTMGLLSGCSKDLQSDYAPSALRTRAYGDKSPTIVTYFDVTQTNPLNASLYRIGSDPFINVAILYGGNIGYSLDPQCIRLHEDLTAILENAETYIRPLQDQGIKVLLSFNGYSTGSGYSNQSSDEADTFTDILVHIVKKYGLDGIDFYEQLSNYSNNLQSQSSFSNIVTMLRQKLDTEYPSQHKLITVADVSSASTLNAEAIAAIDFAWYSIFSYFSYGTTQISGLPNGKWAPQAYSLDIGCNVIMGNTIRNRTAQSVAQGMGAIVMRDLPNHNERDPLIVFQKIAEGAGWENPVERDSAAIHYIKDWVPATAETIINYEDTLIPGPEVPSDPELENQIPLDSMKLIKAVSVVMSRANPLNAGAYLLPDSSSFFDVVMLEEGYFMEMSDNKPDLVAGISKYEEQIKPLQDRGMKVLLTIKSGLGRWGFANLTDELIDELSDQIRDFVISKKLNGVNLVDLDADYDDAYQPRPNTTSYSKMVLALREKLSDKRVITMRHAGYSSTLTSEAINALDRIWTFSLGASSYNQPMTGVPNHKWAPMYIQAGNKIPDLMYKIIINNTRRALHDGMGAIAFHQLDTVNVSGTLTSVASIIYGDSIVVRRTGIYLK